jgi:hypothetical protein
MISPGTEIQKSWRQLAAEVAQETDAHRLAKLTEELLCALDREKGQSDARLQISTRPAKKGDSS